MASIYVHLSGRDTDDAILTLYGRKKRNEGTDGQLKPARCVFCEHENPAGTDYCLRCRRPLNIKAAAEAEKKEREMLKAITPEMIDAMIEKRVNEILTQKKGAL